MREQEYKNELNYQVTKQMVLDMKEKGILSDKDVKCVLEKLKAKYDPLYEV